MHHDDSGDSRTVRPRAPAGGSREGPSGVAGRNRRVEGLSGFRAGPLERGPAGGPAAHSSQPQRRVVRILQADDVGAPRFAPRAATPMLC